jgi:hypothetical protein
MQAERVTPVLATVPEREAAQVADDIREYGCGYIRVDRDGSAHHVPSYRVIVEDRDRRSDSRMHE